MNNEQDKIYTEVTEYYGETLKGTQSLKTNAGCIAKTNLTKQQKAVMSMIHPQITSRFFGCGSPFPLCIQDKTIVDLGCGSGVDVYIASYFAKESGKVIGIDMTPQQLQIGQKYKNQMAQKYGFAKTNVEFIEAKIEKLPLEDNSVDVVISNCVINLTPSKKEVFQQIRRVLKPGGQLYFSDIYTNLRISPQLKNDQVLWGQGLSGALYIQDFRRIMHDIGFKDCRVFSKSNITIENAEIEKKVTGIKYYSITYRCFKLDDEQDRCEDYGQKAKYLGGIEQSEQQFKLDGGHVFKKGESVSICGNTASMLKYSRYGKYFEVDERGKHQGLFDCNKGAAQKQCEGSCC